jgi:HNH endonuclease/AP2 domain
MWHISRELLKELLRYDPKTGLFYWNCARPKIRVGQVAGTRKHHKGYVIIEILSQAYAAHRLAWFYMTGVWPTEHIDHVNKNKSDNRFDNLREATRAQNRANSKTLNKHGLKGVYFHKWLKEKPYEARITSERKQRSLGCFATPEEAHEAYRKAFIELHGEFAGF